MNRTDRAREIARREALGAAWAASAKTLRQELAAEAVAEFEEHGNGVTWTMRDLGRITLPLTEEAAYITDIGHLLKWAKERHPENVETVEQVRAAFQSWLIGNATVAEGGVAVHPETGEVIPGMGVREGGQPKSLSITIARDAKALLASYAEREVAQSLHAEFGEVPDA
jgi:hypothetical protein